MARYSRGPVPLKRYTACNYWALECTLRSRQSVCSDSPRLLAGSCDSTAQRCRSSRNLRGRITMSQPKYPGEIVNRRLCVLLFSIAAFVSAGSAQSRPLSLMTRQVRDVTLNGQAALLGRLPATQTMQLNVVLPL